MERLGYLVFFLGWSFLVLCAGIGFGQVILWCADHIKITL